MNEDEHMIVMNPVLKASISLELVRVAISHAEANNWKIAVVVVDPHGVPMATARMDNVSPPILEFALDKAYTAATMRKSTEAFYERMSSSGSLQLGLSNRPRLVVWGGGMPIIAEGSMVGGIGVSGAQEQDDIACARKALASQGLAWTAKPDNET